MQTVIHFGVSHLKDLITNNQIDIVMETNQEILGRLKFIGYVEKDEKIDIRHVKRQSNNIATKIQRCFIYPDNRINTLKFLKDVINRSFEIAETYIRSDNTILFHGVITDLVKAKQGMINLKYTYSDDTKFCCDIDVLIENIDSKITSIKTTYPECFQNFDENKTIE